MGERIEELPLVLEALGLDTDSEQVCKMVADFECGDIPFSDFVKLAKRKIDGADIRTIEEIQRDILDDILGKDRE